MNIEELKANTLHYIKSLTQAELIKLIKYLDKKYYDGIPVISDEIYDIIMDYYNDNYNSKIKHDQNKNVVITPYYIWSLDKIKPDTNAIINWIKKYEGPYIISDKIDGIAGLIIKKSNEIKIYKARYSGDNYAVKDISYLYKYIIKDNNKLPTNIVLRGEFIIPNDYFNENLRNKFKTPRSAVSSLLNRTDGIDKMIANGLHFVCYNILDPLMNEKNQLEKLKEYNMNVVYYKVFDKISHKILSDILIKRREKSKYTIDGIVVSDTQKIYRIKERNPDHSFAFKMVLTDQIAETIVLYVKWKTSKDNYIIPTIYFQPIIIGNNEIKRAAGHNGKYIKENNIGPGTKIQIIKSGDIIPYVQKIISSTGAQMPKIKYKWDKNNVHIIRQDNNDDNRIKKIHHFFGTLGVKYIGENIIRTLYNAGYGTIISILKLDRDKKFDGIGNTLKNKIISNINRSLLSTNIETLMASSGVFGRSFGIKKIKIILNKYPAFLTHKYNYSDICNIDGIGEIYAAKFMNNIDKFRTFYKKINKIIDISYLLKKNKTEGIFSGRIFVFTGFRDDKIKKFIINNGGIVDDNITKKTNYLIYSDKNSAKYKRAVQLKIIIISKENFISKYF